LLKPGYARFFFRLDGANAIEHMLPPEPNRVTALQAGVDQHVKSYPLPRPDRPAPLIGINVILSPWRETVTLWARQVVDTYGRIGLDHPHLDSPTEKAKHRGARR
jgi:hypothetical protein